MNIPAGLGTCLVTGTFLRALIDSADAGREPDATPLAGANLRLTPSVDHVRYTGATPVIMALTPINLTLDANGVIRDQAGQLGVTILASDSADGDPALWTWEATVTGPDTAPWRHRFVAPTGGTVDLSTTRPVPASPERELAAWQTAIIEMERLLESGRHLYYPQADATGNLNLSAIGQSAILHYNLTGNVTVTALPASPAPGQIITLVLRQDAVGSRTLTVKGATAAYSGVVSIGTAANSRDVVHLIALGDGTWVATMAVPQIGIPAGWAV